MPAALDDLLAAKEGTSCRGEGAVHGIAKFAKRAMTPSIFYISRRLYVLSRYYLGAIYDNDLLFVRNLGPTPLLVDIGANAGQSALCMAQLSPGARIVSFEANSANITDLRVVRRILGARYAYHHAALSDKAGQGWLKVPIAGRTPVPGESSLEDDAFEQEDLEERIGAVARIERQAVGLSTLDSYGLAADFIKIDVQGHELAVIKGSIDTIRRRRPVFMIETNDRNFAAIRDRFAREGYHLSTYDPDRNTLSPCGHPTGINFFALHDEHAKRFSSTAPHG
jgi:FkbM family methyltransferase